MGTRTGAGAGAGGWQRLRQRGPRRQHPPGRVPCAACRLALARRGCVFQRLVGADRRGAAHNWRDGASSPPPGGRWTGAGLDARRTIPRSRHSGCASTPAAGIGAGARALGPGGAREHGAVRDRVVRSPPMCGAFERAAPSSKARQPMQGWFSSRKRFPCALPFIYSSAAVIKTANWLCSIPLSRSPSTAQLPLHWRLPRPSRPRGVFAAARSQRWGASKAQHGRARTGGGAAAARLGCLRRRCGAAAGARWPLLYHPGGRRDARAVWRHGAGHRRQGHPPERCPHLPCGR